MRKNKLGYLGFLGLLGLLGLVTENYGFYGFFGFFGFFAMLQAKGSDERIDKNIDRAARNAFAFDTVAAAFATVYIVGFNTLAWPLALILPFLGILVFSFSYRYYDRKEA